MKTTLQKAEEIAREAHKGQTRWDGEPYITHPEAIAKSLKTDELKIVAWLHDVLEDTNVTHQDLENRGIPTKYLDALDLLTRRKDESYKDMITNIPFNEIARLVKIADLKHNLSNLKKGSMRDKYELSLYLLEVVNS